VFPLGQLCVLKLNLLMGCGSRETNENPIYLTGLSAKSRLDFFGLKTESSTLGQVKKLIDHHLKLAFIEMRH